VVQEILQQLVQRIAVPWTYSLDRLCRPISVFLSGSLIMINMSAEGSTAAVEASPDRFIVLLFNCPVKSDKLLASRMNTGQSIRETLGLRKVEWPGKLLDAILITAFQIAVPLQPGLTMNDSTANILKMMVVYGKGEFKQVTLLQAIPCAKVCDPQNKLNGFCRSSMVVVVRNAEASYLSVWPSTATIGVHQVLGLGHLCEPLLAALGCAAKASIDNVFDYKGCSHAQKQKKP
jgi:hypothetical protein